MIEHLQSHLFGLVHSLTAVAAIVTGLAVLLRRKGTRAHRWIGRSYLISMIATNVTALTIYEVFGEFGPFHWLAVVSLASVLAGYVSAWRRAGGWRARHAYFMVGSYIGVIAAAVSEVVSRVPGWSFGPAVIVGSAAVIAVGLSMMWRLVPRSVRRETETSSQPRSPGGAF